MGGPGMQAAGRRRACFEENKKLPESLGESGSFDVERTTRFELATSTLAR